MFKGKCQTSSHESLSTKMGGMTVTDVRQLKNHKSELQTEMNS